MQLANLQGEDKDAWKYYLQKGKIKEALNACNNAKQKAQVHSERADKMFKSGNYKLAAEHYAKSNYSFEYVCIQFITKDVQSYLMKYLEEVLDIYQKSNLGTDNEL